MHCIWDWHGGMVVLRIAWKQRHTGEMGSLGTLIAQQLIRVHDIISGILSSEIFQ